MCIYFLLRYSRGKFTLYIKLMITREVLSLRTRATTKSRHIQRSRPIYALYRVNCLILFLKIIKLNTRINMHSQKHYFNHELKPNILSFYWDLVYTCMLKTEFYCQLADCHPCCSHLAYTVFQINPMSGGGEWRFQFWAGHFGIRLYLRTKMYTYTCTVLILFKHFPYS